jgi:hypothetical protein
MAVTMKNSVLLDVTQCGSCNNRRFGGKQRFHHKDNITCAMKNGVLLDVTSWGSCKNRRFGGT